MEENPPTLPYVQKKVFCIARRKNVCVSFVHIQNAKKSKTLQTF